MAVMRVDGREVALSGDELAALDASEVKVTRVSRMQGRRALKAAGHLAAVEAYMAALDPDDDARMVYEDASHWERDHPMIASLAAMLSLNDEAVDALFAQAVTYS